MEEEDGVPVPVVGQSNSKNSPDHYSSDSSTCTESLNPSEDESDSVGDAAELCSSMLDFRSINFSPTLALQRGQSEESASTSASASYSFLPDPDAPVYLNLVQYNKAVTSPSKTPKKDLQLQPVKVAQAKRALFKSSPSSSTSSPKTAVVQPFLKVSNPNPTLPVPEVPEPVPKPTPQYPIPGRKFLPHQLPVFRPRKEAPNAITIMHSVEGPLEGLRRAMEERRRVKIWTRNDTRIRGYLVGFVEAFDKHWNIALRDVDETFQRKRRQKGPESLQKGGTVAIRPRSSPRKRGVRKVIPDRVKPESLSTIPLVSKQEPFVPVAGSSEDLLKLCRIGVSNLQLNYNTTKSDIPGREGSQEDKLKSSGLTKSGLRKRVLKIFHRPYIDANGFRVVAQSKKYEIVDRHLSQLFVIGNDIVFIETGSS